MTSSSDVGPRFPRLNEDDISVFNSSPDSKSEVFLNAVIIASMNLKNKSVQKLLEKYKEISTLGRISAVLGWDLNVNLPPKGVEERANQSAYLAKLIVEKWMEPEFKSLLEKANESASAKSSGETREEAAIVRNLNQGARFYHK